MPNFAMNRCYELINTTFLMLDDSDQHLFTQFGLHRRLFYALVWLAIQPDQTITELSGHLLCNKGNATRLVDRMVEAGWASRERDTGDRREVRLRLTAEGQALHDEVLAAYRRFTQERLGALSQTEQQTLATLLDKLREGIEVRFAAHLSDREGGLLATEDD